MSRRSITLAGSSKRKNSLCCTLLVGVNFLALRDFLLVILVPFNGGFILLAGARRQRLVDECVHRRPRHVGVAGFLTATRHIGGLCAAGRHGFADSHKRGGDVAITGVVL